jgi:uncharacterized protein
LTKSAHGVVTGASPDSSMPTDHRHGSPGYIDRMFDGLKCFQGGVLFILSGNDLTAQEFIALIQQDSRWEKLYHSPKISSEILKKANHTFSSQALRDQVATHTVQWVNITGKRT